MTRTERKAIKAKPGGAWTLEKVVPIARARAKKKKLEALEKVLRAARDLVAYRGASQVEAHSLFFSLHVAVNAASTFPSIETLEKIKLQPFFEP